MSSHCCNTFLCSAKGRLSLFRLSVVLVSALLLIPNVALAGDQVHNLALVANGLSKPELGISPSLSIVNLDEPDVEKAVENEVIPLGDVTPSDITVQDHLLYVLNQHPDPFFDPRGGYVEVINLLTRSSLGIIQISADTTPKQMAIIHPTKAYVTGLYSNKIDVLDLSRYRVVKRIPGGPMPDGITILNGKAYVANSSYVKEAGTWNVTYQDNSSVTVIDTQNDTVLKTIPMPISTTGITNDGESKVIAVSAGVSEWFIPGGIPGAVVIIDTLTDEIEKTIDLQTTAGAPAVDSMKRVFINSGGILVYDLVNNQWTHAADNPFSDLGGVSAIDGNDNLYITKADWTGGGMDELYVLSPNGMLLKTYRIGAGASDVALARVQSLPTSVSPRGKLATSWGKLKSRE